MGNGREEGWDARVVPGDIGHQLARGLWRRLHSDKAARLLDNLYGNLRPRGSALFMRNAI